MKIVTQSEGGTVKIPSKIKIGGHWFDVEFIHEDGGFDKCGQKHTWLNKIILQDKMVLPKKMSTLFHEIIHEISWQNELNLTEAQTSSVAEGLYQVLMDNKMLK
jgi:hypothetical protein